MVRRQACLLSFLPQPWMHWTRHWWHCWRKTRALLKSSNIFPPCPDDTRPDSHLHNSIKSNPHFPSSFTSFYPIFACFAPALPAFFPSPTHQTYPPPYAPTAVVSPQRTLSCHLQGTYLNVNSSMKHSLTALFKNLSPITFVSIHGFLFRNSICHHLALVDFLILLDFLSLQTTMHTYSMRVGIRIFYWPPCWEQQHREGMHSIFLNELMEPSLLTLLTFNTCTILSVNKPRKYIVILIKTMSILQKHYYPGRFFLGTLHFQPNKPAKSWLEESTVKNIPPPLTKFIKGLCIDSKITVFTWGKLSLSSN